jgi:hypothetical protein
MESDHLIRSMDDCDSPKIADTFYEHLFKNFDPYSNPPVLPDLTQAAKALHLAVKNCGRNLIFHSGIGCRLCITDCSFLFSCSSMPFMYCTFSFKSTGGVMRDPFDLFDISKHPATQRDRPKNSTFALKQCSLVGKSPVHIAQISGLISSPRIFFFIFPHIDLRKKTDLEGSFDAVDTP